MPSKDATAMIFRGLLFLWSAVLVSANTDVSARSKLVADLAGRAQEGRSGSQTPRQIFNRDGTFAPYSVPCPSGVTWVRPANVS
jgi:hypothetical protein